MSLILDVNTMNHADIVMISYNSLRFLPAFFHFIKSKTRYPYQLFVFDNMSTDGSRAYLERIKKVDSISPRMKLILNPQNFGVSKVWNRGISLGNAPYIVFLNPDIKLTPNWLERMVACAERHPEAGIVGVKILNYNGTIAHAGRIGRVRGSGEKNTTGKYSQEIKVHGIQGSCFLIKRSIIPVIGKFDERFFVYGEEDDYCLRARKAGFSVMYCPVPVYHYHEGSSVPTERRLELRMTSNQLFKHKWKQK